ncbi:cuticle collagen 34-like [Perognathus longimembris pacificus]|uniref:cuticle collagen 34-like n=1 Tax=Perognathus longimembris pacificus TaxID=214514 RepID=UPI00201899F9|nr:cuticle collagen 34-like [Perognathus longimembris pacificus]
MLGPGPPPGERRPGSSPPTTAGAPELAAEPGRRPRRPGCRGERGGRPSVRPSLRRCGPARPALPSLPPGRRGSSLESLPKVSSSPLANVLHSSPARCPEAPRAPPAPGTPDDPGHLTSEDPGSGPRVQTPRPEKKTFTLQCIRIFTDKALRGVAVERRGRPAANRWQMSTCACLFIPDPLCPPTV